MGKNLAIRGHATHGKEVIELLQMMGGNTFNSCMKIAYPNRVYYIGNNNAITWDYIGPEEIDKYEIFTLEEFLKKYPYKVGDKVVYEDDNDIVVINEIKWDNNVGYIFYNVKGTRHVFDYMRDYLGIPIKKEEITYTVSSLVLNIDKRGYSPFVYFV